MIRKKPSSRFASTQERLSFEVVNTPSLVAACGPQPGSHILTRKAVAVGELIIHSLVSEPLLSQVLCRVILAKYKVVSKTVSRENQHPEDFQFNVL